MSHADSMYYPEPPRERKQRGCLFYGCLFTAILALVALIVVAVSLTMAYRVASRAISEYTDTRPIELAKVELPEVERQAVQERWKAFQGAIEEKQPADLELTGPELMVLLDEVPNMRDRLAVTIEDGKIKGQVSIPFDFPGMGKRFLNGTATLIARVEDGELYVELEDAEVKGKPLPDQINAELKKKNLAADVKLDEKGRRILRRIEKLTIDGDRIRIHARGGPDPEPAPGPPVDGPAPPEPPAPPDPPLPPPAPPELPSDPFAHQG
jgi:hypothetical protein